MLNISVLLFLMGKLYSADGLLPEKLLHHRCLAGEIFAGKRYMVESFLRHGRDTQRTAKERRRNFSTRVYTKQDKKIQIPQILLRLVSFISHSMSRNDLENPSFKRRPKPNYRSAIKKFCDGIYKGNNFRNNSPLDCVCDNCLHWINY